MDAVVKEEEDSVNEERNMIEPKEEVIDETFDLIEPKVELVDEIGVKMEEIDEDEYQHIIPYEYRDYIEQHTEEEQPTNSRKRKASDVECQKCRKTIRTDGIENAERHAASHTNIYRYSCPVEGCDYKNWVRHYVTLHMKNTHKIGKPSVKDVVCRELSEEDKEELRKLVEECFPGMKQDRDTYLSHEKEDAKKTAACLVCKKCIVVDSYITAENHAATHTNIKRFSCPVEGCDYNSYLHYVVIKHMKQKHKMDKPNAKNVARRELSDDEKEQLKRVMENCFPEVTKRKTNPNALYKFDCQLCNGSISELGYSVTSGRRNHAFTHTDIMLYECIEPECDFKTKYFESFRKHQTSKHGKIAEMIPNVKRKLAPENVLKIEEMVYQCFPELKALPGIAQEPSKTDETVQSPNFSKRCDVCHKTLHINDLESKDFRRFHALSHTDIMLYKCCKEDCDFKAPNRYSITNHQKWMHNMKDMPVIQIELTNEQEMEVGRMMAQCFPEWNGK